MRIRIVKVNKTRKILESLDTDFLTEAPRNCLQRTWSVSRTKLNYRFLKARLIAAYLDRMVQAIVGCPTDTEGQTKLLYGFVIVLVTKTNLKVHKQLL